MINKLLEEAKEKLNKMPAIGNPLPNTYGEQLFKNVEELIKQSLLKVKEETINDVVKTIEDYLKTTRVDAREKSIINGIVKDINKL